MEKIKVAYFSMEIGITEDVHTYSGGLGVLAGDTLKSAADLGMPLVGVTLLHREGFLRQNFNDHGEQLDHKDPWDIDRFLNKLDVQAHLKVEGRDVKVNAWSYELKGITNKRVPIIFLDTNVEGNSDYDKSLTNTLYGGDQQYRLCQELVLGVAGVKILKELGYEINTYHMNEGHAALLTMELLNQVKDEVPGKTVEEYKDMVRKKCVFTTHTPVPAGHDSFDHQLVGSVLKDYPGISWKFIEAENGLNMTELALKYSRFCNAVARRHGEVSRNMFPGYTIKSITNGIHSRTWVNKYLTHVLDCHIPIWNESPEALREALRIPDEEILESHSKAKEDLINYVKEKKGLDFKKDVFTIGFARRATGYKRAFLLFDDIKKLKEIQKEKGRIQVIYGGKAHPNDGEGKGIIKQLNHLMKETNDLDVVYLEDYGMDLAKLMVAGVDLWLNTPLRPNEASGTSGMKAAHNGVPSFSILDGWWLEGWLEGKTGWAIGEHYNEGDNQNEVDGKSIYEKLPKIMDVYYKDKKLWADVMKHCIATNAAYFNTHRMVKEYVSKGYFK